MPNPLAATHRLLTTLMGDKSATSAEQARRVEAIIELLEQHTPEELLEVAAFLEKTKNAKDRSVAFAAAKGEVEKLPTKAEEAQPVEAEAAAKR